MALKMRTAVAAATIALIAACGGGASTPGGNDVGTGAPPVTLNGPTITGLAATGVAFEAARIAVFDSTGTPVGGSSTPVGRDGRYSATYLASAMPPLLVVATRSNGQGAVETLVGLAPTAGASGATANITPVTTLIASLLARSGNPANLPAEIAARTAEVSPAAIASKTTLVQALLAPVLEATGTRTVDPLATPFSVDGAGYDRLLDTLKVTIIPANDTTADIEIGLRMKLADGAMSPATRFTNRTAASAAPLPTVTSDALVAAGTSALITDLLERTTACYSQPIGQRVSSGGTTHAEIIFAACRGLFAANSPAAFKDNGSAVGAGQSFSGLFSADATGTTFSQGNYEYTNAGGDVLVAFKTRSPSGDESYSSLFVRPDNDGRLKFVGNQYAFQGAVSSFQQLRRFIKQSPERIDYLSSGYSITINNVNGGSGLGGSLFNRVVVTSPFGDQFTFKPTIGTSVLMLESRSGTNVIRLRNGYTEQSNTANPCVLDVSMYCLDATRFSDADVQALPASSVWRFDYHLASSSSATPDAVQYVTTRARALTLEEFRMQGWAELAGDDITRLRMNLSTTDNFFPLRDLTSFTMNYTVPPAAVPPYALSLFGRAVGVGFFDDSVGVKPSDRQGTIGCTSNGAADVHCVAGSSLSSYSASAGAVSLQMIARDAAGRVFSSYYGLYIR